MLVDKEKWFKAIDETERRWMAWCNGSDSDILYCDCPLCEAADGECDTYCVFNLCIPNGDCMRLRTDLQIQGRAQARPILIANFKTMRDYVRGCDNVS